MWRKQKPKKEGMVGGEEEEAKAEGRYARRGACDRQCGEARRRSSNY